MPFVALHWRYDRRDFLGPRCSRFRRFARPGPSQGFLSYEKACHIFNPIFKNPKLLAQKLANHMEGAGIKNLYIAAPPEEEQFVREVAHALSNHAMAVKDGSDVESYLKKRFENCAFIKTHFLGTLSIVEQEVCFQSAIFYRSLKSTWSSNIRDERRVHRNGDDQTRDVLNLLGIAL